MIYRIIGDTAMVVHAAFILYMAIGGFLAWRWPRTFWIHLGCALYGLSISVVGWICPLTHVENWGRENAGQNGLSDEGFIDHYLTGVIYPADHLVTVQAGVGAVVVLSWAGLAALTLRRRRTRARTPA
jgi:drug/metabolite transporter superfamily protein YnfA